MFDFQDVYREHFCFVWKTLARLGVREVDLMDITQNVFLIVHRQLPGFEGRSELTTWLFSICRLVAKDYRQAGWVRQEVTVDARAIAQWGGADNRTLNQLDSRELAKLLETILSDLPDKLRVVFVMFELDEMSGEEIARLLNVPVGTVRSRLRLARESFRRKATVLTDPDAASPSAPALLPRLAGDVGDLLKGAKDPRRLRYTSGSVESLLLLQASRTLEPPASAQARVLGKLEALARAGATGSKLAAKALVPPLLKWAAMAAATTAALGISNHHARPTGPSASECAPEIRPAPEALSLAPAALLAPAAASPVPPPSPAPAIAVSTRAPHTAAGSAAPRALDAPSILQAESSLLAVARARLASGDPKGALEDVAHLTSRVPQGVLTQERELVAIESLDALGSREQLRSRALAFVDRFPRSPYARHIRRLLER
jgi:RNA polymerase sigma-70 factor (ECF subfamily)